MYLITVEGEHWYNRNEHYVANSLEKAYAFAKKYIENMEIYWVEEDEAEEEREKLLKELKERYEAFGERFYVIEVLECEPIKEIE